MKIIHISDLHYGATGHKVKMLVEKIINFYSSHEIKPLIINSGDLVEDGKKEQMYSCRKHLQKLIDAGFEMLICPGNHDLKKFHSSIPIINGARRFENYFNSLLPNGRNYFGENDNNLNDFPIVHTYGNNYFIGLDSNEKQRGSGAKGELGSDQLDDLKNLIEQIKNEDENSKIIVYLHHHPFKYRINLPGPFDYDNMKLLDRVDLLQIIKGNIDVLLFGHVHKYERFTDEENELNIPIIQLCANSTHGNSLQFSEIDLEKNSIELY